MPTNICHSHLSWPLPLALLACCTAVALPASAQEPLNSTATTAEITRLRADFAQQLQALQGQYEARLAALEAQLAQLPAAAATPAGATATSPVAATNASALLAPASAPMPDKTPVAFTTAAGNQAAAFNPEISLVLQGAFVRQRDIEERQPTGYVAAGHDHDTGQRGFTLGHSELMLAANVDAYWRAQANFAVADDQLEVEEAWFQTLGLGQGWRLKAGRFLSAISHANEQHAHAWDFADTSLMQRVLFGEHLRHDGVQLTWLAPSEQWLEFGVEAARGASFPGSEAGGNRNAAGSWTAFARSGGDLGVTQSWRAGLGYLAARPRERAAHLEDLGGIEAHASFTGQSRTWLADVVWKWAPQGNAREQQLSLQAALFRRHEQGRQSCEDNTALGGACPGLVDDWRQRQYGGYAQGVWQFRAGWRLGYRYDQLAAGRLTAGTLPFAAAGYRPQRHSLMADWSPSEFSRVRLQLARDRSLQGVVDNQLRLQYILSIGAHGAHGF